MNAASIAATLKAKGQPMTLTRTTAGTSTFDPVTGGYTGGATSTNTYTVNGITKTYKLSTVNASGSLIQVGDKEALFEAGIVVPVPGDKLTVMGVVWTVISVNELSPQGERLLFTAQIRK
jgi:hypothetical protein